MIKEALTFDDVLLVPKRSAVFSRKEVDVSTKLTKNIKLNIPIISANMDTVTESRMAIAMAKLGGLGIIHRFLPIEKQVNEVIKVKRAENYIIDDPFVISPETKLSQAKIIMKKFDIQSLLVVDKERKLLGILTKRDFLFEEDESKKISQLMSPRKKLIVGNPKTSLEKAKEIFKKFKIEKLPLVDKNNKLTGLITAKDILHRLNPLAVRDKKGRLLVGGAVGAKGDYLERTEKLIKAGVDLIVVDIAHGHLEICLKAVKEIKRKFPDIDLMAGNVATYEGAKDLINQGADIVKVGIGPGSTCKTRLITGAGVPQLTAIMEAKKGAKDISIIADGGIKNAGDITKALAAGASAVMIGLLLAGTDESPGEIVLWNNKRSKIYRGMASLKAYLKRNEKNQENNDALLSEFVSEGAEEVVIPYQGSAKEIIDQLIGGLKSGMSYCGAKNIKELQRKAEFVKITEAGKKESEVRDVKM